MNKRSSWFNDYDELFNLNEHHIDGDWHYNLSESWCDARKLNRDQLLERLNTCNPNWSYSWFIVISPEDIAQARELAIEVKKRWPRWNCKWLVQQCGENGDVLRVWMEIIENRRYQTTIEWYGYSHDGSEDYYTLDTRPC